MASSEGPGSERGADDQANPFLISLAGAIHQARRYKPDNRILTGPRERLSTLLKDPGHLGIHPAGYLFMELPKGRVS